MVSGTLIPAKVVLAMSVVARVVAERGFCVTLVKQLANANTVEAAMKQLKMATDSASAKALWTDIEHRIAACTQAWVPAVERMEGHLLIYT